MDFVSKPSFWVKTIVIVVALLIVQQFWHWEVERVEVPPGKFLVRVHRWGTNLPEDEIIAANDSYKGVMLEPLAEGRHFLNPIFWSYEIHPMVQVKSGQCLVVTRKFGERLPEGEVVATEDPEKPYLGQRGILRDVKMQGSYRLNTHAYSWEFVPAVEIRADQVGVKILKVGPQPPKPQANERGRYAVKSGFRGVQEDYVPPGSYYLNPYVATIIPVEVRRHLCELVDIEFPSRDGFILKPHITVEYAVQPKKAPELVVRISDEGKLHQEDETKEQQDRNEILQKIIFPHIRGYARIEGSKFDAKDFIGAESIAGQKTTNNREKLQKAMEEQVKPKCAELGVNVIAVILSDDMGLPKELKDQISQRDQALVDQERNKNLLKQYVAEQKLRAAEGLKQQAGEKVRAETRRKQATIKADQKKEVEEARLKQDLSNAQLQLEAAREQKVAILEKAQAEATVIERQNDAEVAGLRKAIQGFAGVQNFAQFHIMSRLAPALTEIFASDESEFARLFSSFMNPPNGGPRGPMKVTETKP